MISRQAWLWYCASLFIVILDQLSKLWVSRSLTYGVPVELAPFFNFTLLHNHGAAFSFLSDAGGWQRWFFAIIALVVSVTLVIWIARVVAKSQREAFALAFILGGALGNLVDRVALGYVVDFIVLHYSDNFFPAFNLADSAITLGAGVLILDLFLKKEMKSNA